MKGLHIITRLLRRAPPPPPPQPPLYDEARKRRQAEAQIEALRRQVEIITGRVHE